MQKTSTNIKFNYEYRDAGNYHSSGNIIFKASENNLDIEILELQVRDLLFDKEFFYPYKLSIPLIHFDEWNPELDHDWYRFENLELTDELPTDSRSIEIFLLDIKKFGKQAV